jgi:hypothetical protein
LAANALPGKTYKAKAKFVTLNGLTETTTEQTINVKLYYDDAYSVRVLVDNDMGINNINIIQEGETVLATDTARTRAYCLRVNRHTNEVRQIGEVYNSLAGLTSALYTANKLNNGSYYGIIDFDLAQNINYSYVFCY